MFGDITGCPVGSEFPTYEALNQAKVHTQKIAGISGKENVGAESIVVSEKGYEDDEDLGDTILYTGQGGRAKGSRTQTFDQPFTRGNKALVLSQNQGLPIRVIRGKNRKSPFAPAQGYRYDGLYFVSGSSEILGKSGFKVWMFKLEREPGQPRPWPPTADNQQPQGNNQPGRILVTTLRIVRDTAVSREVKKINGFQCQICDSPPLQTKTGLYAEGAHIRGLGRPHNGPDVMENILCLCPNCHVLFDKGGLKVDRNLTVFQPPGTRAGTLIQRGTHRVDPDQLDYHFNL